MDHGELDVLAAGVDPVGGPAEAWELVLAAGFAVAEARRSVFHRSDACFDELATVKQVSPASER